MIISLSAHQFVISGCAQLLLITCGVVEQAKIEVALYFCGWFLHLQHICPVVLGDKAQRFWCQYGTPCCNTGSNSNLLHVQVHVLWLLWHISCNKLMIHLIVVITTWKIKCYIQLVSSELYCWVSTFLSLKCLKCLIFYLVMATGFLEQDPWCWHYMMQVMFFWRLGNLQSTVALRLCQAFPSLSLPYPGSSFASSIFHSLSFGAPGM